METQAIRDVIRERERQITEEGFTAEHDDKHDGGQLAIAAAIYALHDVNNPQPFKALEKFWPFEGFWFKPGLRRNCLVKAAAMLIAEIERIDRKANAKKPFIYSGTVQPENGIDASGIGHF